MPHRSDERECLSTAETAAMGDDHAVLRPRQSAALLPHARQIALRPICHSHCRLTPSQPEHSKRTKQEPLQFNKIHPRNKIIIKYTLRFSSSTLTWSVDSCMFSYSHEEVNQHEKIRRALSSSLCPQEI